jgi:hypothetical protein
MSRIFAAKLPGSSAREQTSLSAVLSLTRGFPFMINGAILVGGEETQAEARFDAIDPSTGAVITPSFSNAGSADVAAACAKADAATIAFAELSPESRAAFDKALQRLVASGQLRRIDRGLYDQPSQNRLTGLPSPPDPRAVIDAIARRDQIRVLVDGLTRK